MKRLLLSFAFISCILGFLPKLTSAQDLTVDNYSLVSSQRVSRFEYDYTYHADITNTGPAAQNVTATLTSNSQYTTVMEGDLAFGDVPEGGTVTSYDTFIIRVNRRYPFSEEDLLWDISLPDSTPPTLLIDYPADEAYVGTVTPNIVISFDDTGSGVNLTSFYVEINGVDYTDYFTVSETGANYQVPDLEPLPEDINYILVSIQDNEGNFTEVSSNFYVKTLKLIERVSKVIPASEGGEIEITENESMYNAGVKLEIPPGALTEDTEVKINDVVGGYPPFPENTTVVGLPIYLGPTGLTFLTQATLKIPYTNEELTFSEVNDPSKIKVMTYNSSTEAWEEVPVESIDTVNKHLIVRISHFSLWVKFKDGVKSALGLKGKEDEVFEFITQVWEIPASYETLQTIWNAEVLGNLKLINAISAYIAAIETAEAIKNRNYSEAAFHISKWGVPLAITKIGFKYLGAYASLGFQMGDFFISMAKDLDIAAYNRQINNYVLWREQGWTHEAIIAPGSDPRVFDGWLLKPNCAFQTFCNSKPVLQGKWTQEDIFNQGKKVYEIKYNNSLEDDENKIKTLLQNALDNPDAVLAPVPKIIVTPSSQRGNPPFSVIFDGSESYGKVGVEIASYMWDFGDGGTSTNETVSHTYETAGNYTVKLTVTDNGGKQATGQTYIEVVTYDLNNQLPTADFSYSFDSGNSLKVYFDGSLSSDSDGNIAKYWWSFGDASVKSGVSVAHTFLEAGQYEVKLEVVDNGYAPSEKVIQIDVKEDQFLPTPTNPRVSGNPDNLNPIGVRLNWDAVQDPEGDQVYYCVTVNEDSEPRDIPLYQACENGNFIQTTSFILPLVLDYGKTYWWAVWAKDEHDVWSSASEWSNFTTHVSGIENYIEVGKSGYGYPYQKIQDAINDANDGDIVLVHAGTYHELITFTGGKTITVLTLEKATINGDIDYDGIGDGRVVTFNEGDSSTLEGFTITNGDGGISCLSSSPTIKNCKISKNKSSSHGGGILCYGSGLPAIMNCEISNNNSAYDGGGVYCGSATISNCSITGNSTIATSPYGRGGGIFCSSLSPITITNCTITGNAASTSGGAIYCSSSSPSITNCTISGNSGGAGIYCAYSSRPKVVNSILWGNNNEIYLYRRSSINITYSNIGGGWGTQEEMDANHNVNTDPLFVAQLSLLEAPTIGGDYHLRHNSPCIDAANSNEPAPFTDKDGNSRYDDPVVMNMGAGSNGSYYDMGAYEFGGQISCYTPASIPITVADREVWGYICQGNFQKHQFIQEKGKVYTIFLTPIFGRPDLYIAGTESCIDQTPHFSSCNYQSLSSNGEVRAITHIAPYSGIQYLSVYGVQESYYNIKIANTVEVGQAGTVYPYSKIQDAINDANNEDTVLVHGGTYNELVRFDGSKTICVRTEENAVINGDVDQDGVSDGRVVSFTGSDSSTLEGFTITNGVGGIICGSGSLPTIANCKIEKNVAYQGGGIASSGSPTIINCSIIYNISTGVAGGGGVYLGGTGKPIIKNSIINNNTATGYGGDVTSRGGGVYCQGGPNPTFTNCSINFNSPTAISGSKGGSFRGVVSLLNCNIIGNYGSATAFWYFGAKLTNCIISANTSGLYAYASSLTLTNCIITGNYGAGVQCNYMGYPNIAYCTISGNSGGGITSTYRGVGLFNSIVWGNGNYDIYVNPPYYYTYANSTINHSNFNSSSYSYIEGTLSEINNTHSDPMFVDPFPAWQTPNFDGDYRIGPTSPCKTASETGEEIGAYGNNGNPGNNLDTISCNAPGFSSPFVFHINPTCYDRWNMEIFYREINMGYLETRRQSIYDEINGVLDEEKSKQLAISAASNIISLYSLTPSDLNNLSNDALVATATEQVLSYNSALVDNEYAQIWVGVFGASVQAVLTGDPSAVSAYVASNSLSIFEKFKAALNVYELLERANEIEIAKTYLKEFYGYGSKRDSVALSYNLDANADLTSIIRAIGDSMGWSCCDGLTEDYKPENVVNIINESIELVNSRRPLFMD